MTAISKVRLGEVVTSAGRSTKPESIDPESSYVLLEHISAGTGEAVPGTTGDYEIRSAKSHFLVGDVLYGKLRPNLRKVCVASYPGYCSTDILALRPVEQHSSFYIASVLRSERFLAEVKRLVGGANLPRVNAKELLNLEIPWLEGPERKRFDDLARLGMELRQQTTALASSLDDFERSLWGAG